jgi:hypothetical protein
MCLFAAVLAGLMTAAGGIWAGWHPLAALPVFSFAGSFALIVTSLIVVPGEAPRSVALPVEPVVIPGRAPA